MTLMKQRHQHKATLTKEENQREIDTVLRKAAEAASMNSAEVFVEAFNELSGGKPFEKFSWIRLGNLYALACICYYQHDFSPTSDAMFDSLCLYLLENLDEALANRAGGLGAEKYLDEDMLAAGSGYDMSRFSNWLLDVADFVEMIMRRQQRIELTG